MQPHLTGAITISLWSLSAAYFSFALRYASAIGIVIPEYWLLLIAFFLLKKKANKDSTIPMRYGLFFLIGLAYVGHNIFFALALQSTNDVSATTLSYLWPVILALYLHRSNLKDISKTDIIFLLIIFIGTIMITASTKTLGFNLAFLPIGLLSALSAALYMISYSSPAIRKNLNTATILFKGLIYVSPIMLIFTLIFINEITFVSFILGGISAIFLGVIPELLWARTLLSSSGKYLAIAGSTIPIWSMLLLTFITKDKLNNLLLLGSFFIIISVTILVIRLKTNLNSITR